MAPRRKTGGRKAGTPNKVNAATRDRIEAEGDPVGLLIAIAKGDPLKAAPVKDAADAVETYPTTDQRLNAARWLGERLVPPAKSRAVQFSMPSLEKPEDLPAAIDAVISAAAAGSLRLDEADTFISLIDSKRKALETADLAARVAALEEASQKAAGAR